MGMEDCGRGRFGGAASRVVESVILSGAVILSAALAARAQDVPSSKDPAGMKRYEGSDLIGYRAPQFDEYLLPLGPPTSMAPPAYAKSIPVEGLVSFYTYMAPAGRTPAELYRNYRQEFLRLGIQTLYEKGAAQRGWFGPTFNDVAAAAGVSQILAYNEAEERLLVGKTKDTRPAYYLVFVTAYKDGVIPDRLRGKIEKGRALAQLVVVTPEQMEKKMTFVNADEMEKALHDSGKVALYGLYFDTDKDVVKAESRPTLDEIAKLMRSDPALRLRVVGHTDNQGKSDYNVDLSRRRAASVVRTLTSRFGIAANRLDAFGCGPYCPAAANGAEDGRTKNRRVELVEW
jgi:OOP family OmpA-OmpF porin